MYLKSVSRIQTPAGIGLVFTTKNIQKSPAKNIGHYNTERAKRQSVLKDRACYKDRAC